MGFQSGVKYERLKTAVKDDALKTLTAGGSRKNGKHIQLYCKYRDEGRYKLLSVNTELPANAGKRQRDNALRDWRELLVQDLTAVAGEATDTSRTVGQVCEAYLDERTKLDKDGNTLDVRWSTLGSYRYAVQRLDYYPALRDMPLHDVQRKDIQAWLDSMAAGTEDRDGISYASIQTSLTVLRAAIRWADVADVTRGVRVPRNVRKGRETKEYTGRPNRLDENGLQHLYDELDGTRSENIRRAGYLGVQVGLRREELCGLLWENVDLEAGVLRVRQVVAVWEEWHDGKRTYHHGIQPPKTVNSVRDIPLPSGLVDTLRQWRDADGGAGYVLHDREGHFLDPVKLSKQWGQFGRRHGIQGVDGLCTIHDLRHTFGSLHVANGTNVVVLADLMGHSDVSVTLRRYCAASPADRRKAVEKMDSIFNPATAEA